VGARASARITARRASARTAGARASARTIASGANVRSASAAGLSSPLSAHSSLETLELGSAARHALTGRDLLAAARRRETKAEIYIQRRPDAGRSTPLTHAAGPARGDDYAHRSHVTQLSERVGESESVSEWVSVRTCPRMREAGTACENVMEWVCVRQRTVLELVGGKEMSFYLL